MQSVDLNFRMNATGNAVPEIRKAQGAVQRLGTQIDKSNAKMRGFNNGITTMQAKSRKFAMSGLQQAGYQIGDYAVQVANGTSKMQAFGQQAPQLLQIFGPIGAIVGAGVAIFAAFGVVLQRSGKDLTNFGAALGVLQEPLSQVAGAVKGVSSLFGSAFPTIVQNIDTALIAVGIFAGLTLVKMVPSMLAASGASTFLSSAMMTVRASILAAALSAGRFTLGMVALRSAALLTGAAFKAAGAILMRFLPIAVLVGFAKLVEMFLQLRKGAGGFGAALGLLRDVAVESFNRMLARGQMMYLKLRNGILNFQKAFINALVPIAARFDVFVNAIVDKFNSAFPEDSMLAPLRIGVSPDFAGDLKSVSDDIGATIDANKDKISELNDVLSGPNKSIAAIREAFRNGASDADFFGSSVADAAKVGASSINENLTPAIKAAIGIVDTIGKSMETAMMSIADGTKSVKDAFKSMASEIIKELYRIFVVKKITGFITGAIEGYFNMNRVSGTSTPLGTGNVRPKLRPSSFAGGGYTGNGARAGGLDGKGGYMAMIHPRETVVDHAKGQGSGVTVIQNNTFGSGVSRAEVNAMLPKMVEATKAAVADAKLRGGSYGRSFA